MPIPVKHFHTHTDAQMAVYVVKNYYDIDCKIVTADNMVGYNLQYTVTGVDAGINSPMVQVLVSEGDWEYCRVRANRLFNGE